jgi:Tfp pilus assembly protein PilW
MNRTTQSPLAPQRRARRRAFTIVEVLVALSAGVLVSMAAFALSKNATNFFQHEARVSSAQLAVTLGLNRIANDLSRASFLSTPNAQADPMVCKDASWSNANGLRSLAGVQITPGGLTATSQSGVNGFSPETLIVGGSLDAAESFTVQCVLSGAGGAPSLQLQDPIYDNAMARVMASLATGETLLSRLNTIFVPGRFVQILDPASGYKLYGVIGSGTPVAVAGNVATVQLAQVPAIPTKPASPCGILAPPSCGAGLLVSVVYRAKYDIRSLAGVAGAYSAMVAPTAATGDAGRTELVRVELDSTGAEKPASLQLVSEYAVDMRFGLTVTSKVQNDIYNPSITTYELGDSTATATMHTLAGDVINSTAKPQLIRSVQVRLATRTRAPDRDTDLPTGKDGRRLHFSLNPALRPGYARVRTGYVNVGLLNQGGFSLW